MLSFFHLRKIFQLEKSSKRFFTWAVLGLAFSQSVIVSTLGLMNGFEKSMKESISTYLPEINVTHRFSLALTKEDLVSFRQIAPSTNSFLYNALDGFLLKSNKSSAATRNFELPVDEINKKFKVQLSSPNEIIIGRGLAEKLRLKTGEEVTFLTQEDSQRSLGFSRKKIKKIIDFPIFEQSQRFVFSIKPQDKKFFNHIGLSVPGVTPEEINSLISEIETQMDFNYKVEPYWSDFKFLLEAVEVEKKSISIILQVIVLVAIFNVVAFLLYFKEVNARKIFILSAFGMSKKRRLVAWRKLTLVVWSLSCFISIFFVFAFDMALRYLPIFELPAKIYYLNRLSIKWSVSDFLMIFMVSLIILFLITSFFIRNIEKSSILKNLREEFN